MAGDLSGPGALLSSGNAGAGAGQLHDFGNFSFKNVELLGERNREMAEALAEGSRADDSCVSEHAWSICGTQCMDGGADSSSACGVPLQE